MHENILDYWEEFDEGAHLALAQNFDFESEARLAQAKLRNAGIRSAITHSLIAGTIPLGLGAIRLYVLEDDLSEACRLLAEMERKKREDPAHFYPDADEEDIQFLQNLSGKTHKKRFSWLIVGLLIIIFLILRLIYFNSPIMTI